MILLICILFSFFTSSLIQEPVTAAPVNPFFCLAIQINPNVGSLIQHATVTCAGECQCLYEADAAAAFGGNHEQCAAMACEYDTAGTAKFCYHAKIQQPTTEAIAIKVQPQVIQNAYSLVPTPTPTTEAIAMKVQPQVIQNAYSLVPTPSPPLVQPGLLNTTSHMASEVSSDLAKAAKKTWSSRDALFALQISVGKLPYSADFDLNEDGKVDSSDAREILRNAVMNPG
jgi:hypothetical protein